MLLTGILIIIAMLFYYKFIYYRYHESDVTPVTILILGIAAFFIGLFYFLVSPVSDIVLFRNIVPIHLAIVVYLFVSYYLVYRGYKKNRKHMNKHIDIMLTFAKRIGMWKIIPALLVASFPAAFFIVYGSFIVLGYNNLLIWMMILVAWLLSNLRLMEYDVAKQQHASELRSTTHEKHLKK
ncbi:MAG: hypothetical protein ABIG30_03310 [Candidatus Aenigmatarchaeota archaeon]